MQTTRSGKYGAALALLSLLNACADPTSTAPDRTASRSVRLSLAAQVNAAASAIRVSIGYRRTGSATTIVLTDTRIIITAEPRGVPVSVDISTCLGDPQHEISTTGNNTGASCMLYVTATLLDAGNQQLDQATLPAMTVRPGEAPFAAVSLGTRASFVSLAPGRFLSCRSIKTSGGGTTCWGSARANANETTIPVLPQTAVAASADFVDISAGDGYVCGLTVTGSVACWGRTGTSVLGSISQSTRTTPSVIAFTVPFIQLVTSFSAACGLAQSGIAYCWGENAFGQLGDGTQTARPTPAPVLGNVKFKRLTAGPASNIICGLTEGPVYCWGTLGLVVPPASQVAGGPTSIAPASSAITAIAPGNDHVCGLAGDGTAVCYGSNTQGQLGDGTTTQRSSFVFVTGNVKFSSITAGLGFTCGIATDGRAYCWGQNDQGQLGDGTTTRRLVPTPVATSTLFATLAAGIGHVCGATSSGAISCWGSNSTGQLGDGTTTNRLVPTAVK
ncbi:MAG TPA: hypothetical protein VIP11_25870 [Gemmatimonadaceae bacterium]